RGGGGGSGGPLAGGGWCSIRVAGVGSRRLLVLAVGGEVVGFAVTLRGLAGVFLPSAADDVDVARVEFDEAGLGAYVVGGDEGGAGAAEQVEDDAAGGAGVGEHVLHERDGFHGGVLAVRGGLVVGEDGGLGVVAVPVGAAAAEPAFAAGGEAVQDRLVLPVVVGAAHDHHVFGPDEVLADEDAGSAEAGFEGDAFEVGVGDVDRGAGAGDLDQDAEGVVEELF